MLLTNSVYSDERKVQGPMTHVSIWLHHLPECVPGKSSNLALPDSRNFKVGLVTVITAGVLNEPRSSKELIFEKNLQQRLATHKSLLNEPINKQRYYTDFFSPKELGGHFVMFQNKSHWVFVI